MLATVTPTDVLLALLFVFGVFIGLADVRAKRQYRYRHGPRPHPRVE